MQKQILGDETDVVAIRTGDSSPGICVRCCRVTLSGAENGGGRDSMSATCYTRVAQEWEGDGGVFNVLFSVRGYSIVRQKVKRDKGKLEVLMRSLL